MNGLPVFSNKITRFFSRPEVARWTRILFVIVWIILLGSIFWYAWRNWNEIIPYFQNLKPGSLKQLWWVFFAYIGSLISAILCWVAIMSVFDKKHGWVKHAQVFCLTLASRRLPGTFWYIGGRMSVYQKLGLPQKSILFASSIELVLTTVTGLSLGIIFLLGQGSELDLKIIMLIVAALIIGVILVNPWTLHWFTRKFKLEIHQRITFFNILVWMSFAVLMWLLSGIMLVKLVSIFTAVDTSSALILVRCLGIIWCYRIADLLLPLFVRCDRAQFNLLPVDFTALACRDRNRLVSANSNDLIRGNPIAIIPAMVDAIGNV